MKVGIAALVAGYVLSQFYRAFLAVLTPALGADLGATPADLGRASGLWFLCFALMQLPVGWALDRIGPRWTTAVLLALGGGGGATLFALATSPLHIQVAMGLIGIGCAPVLMAGYFIFARVYPPQLFGTLAGAMIGVASLGNVAGSVPLAWLVEAVGWRAAMGGTAVATLVIAALIAALVRNPPLVAKPQAGPGGLRAVLAIRALWPMFPLLCLNYIIAGGLRGLWIGPYLGDVQGLDASGIGWATLAMGLAMIAGNFAYGPMDRLLRSRKRPVLIGNLLAGSGCLILAAAPTMPLAAAVALIAALGFFGASFPLILAHGRAFLPPHLTGRGVTLMNLCSIGGAGLFQYASSRLHAVTGGDWTAMFLMFGLPLLAASAFYAFSRDNLS